jgi:hypothetical protein
MTNDKSKILGIMSSMAMMSNTSIYRNPYEGLSDVNMPYSTVSYAKSRLTNKQKKARAKAKQAKIARRRNR